MAETKGTITALDGAHALVRVDDSGCGRCHEPGGCGGVNIGKMLCSAPQVFRVLNQGNSEVGQRVIIAVPDGVVRRGAFLAYGLPLLTLLIGAFVGSGVAGDPGAMIGAVAGLVIAFGAVRLAPVKRVAGSQFQPYIDAGVPRK